MGFVNNVNVVATLFNDLGTQNIIDAADSASTSASNAKISEDNAKISEDNAKTSSTEALSYLEDFKGRYFGGLASDPSTDLNGDALTDGDLYFNTATKAFRAYDSATTSWKELSAYTKTELDTISILRADKYLAAQAVANMVYTNNKLTKVQYNNATDVDYEVLGYDAITGKLTTVDHYTGGVLQGTTTLTYTADKLTSAIYA